MTSYRVTVVVGLLRPGVDAEAVLPAAADAARALTTVEAHDLGVVRGQARVVVRYDAADDDAALDVARQVVARVAELAQTQAPAVTRRYGARWYPVGVADGYRSHLPDASRS